MKKTWIILVLLGIAMHSQAQKDTSYWKCGTTFGANVNEVYLRNWVAGGQNSIAWTLLSNAYANYEKGKLGWTNTLEMGYGMTKLGKFTDSNSFKKTEDKIIYVSKLSYIKSQKLKMSALSDFRTQFANGYIYSANPLVPGTELRTYTSRFLAPAYWLLALGVDYNPNKDLYVFYSPLTMKTTIVADPLLADAGAFGVQPAERDALGLPVAGTGKAFRFEPGSHLRATYKKEVMQNITYQSTLVLFWAYSVKDYATNKYVFNKNIDMIWDNLLLMKVNKFINVTVGLNMIYDDDVDVTREDGSKGPDLQIKQSLALGFQYSIKNK